MISISILIDSSVLVSAYNEDDKNHKTGLKILKDVEDRKYGEEYFISDYIFDETVTVIFSKMGNKDVATKIGTHLVSSFIVLWVTNTIFSAAFEMFSKKNKLSFTDCTILEMAKIYGVRHIATFDKEIKKYFTSVVDS